MDQSETTAAAATDVVVAPIMDGSDGSFSKPLTFGDTHSEEKWFQLKHKHKDAKMSAIPKYYCPRQDPITGEFIHPDQPILQRNPKAGLWQVVNKPFKHAKGHSQWKKTAPKVKKNKADRSWDFIETYPLKTTTIDEVVEKHFMIYGTVPMLAKS